MLLLAIATSVLVYFLTIDKTENLQQERSHGGEEGVNGPKRGFISRRTMTTRQEQILNVQLFVIND